MYCMICKENRAGGDGLCVKCRFKMNTQNKDVANDLEILLPEGRYVGKARNGIPNGKGELTYNEHDSRKSYKGDFKDGMRHGKGKLIFRNDAYYDGEWVNDKYEGYGEESLPGGNLLEGYYKDGRLTSGRVIFGDGREYEGEWSDDMPNGTGKMYFRDGHAEEGYWVNGICAFREAPTEEQIAQFLAEQEQRALAENPLEEEEDRAWRQQNTELPPDESLDSIWNTLAREELAAVEEDEGAPLLFAGMEDSPNIAKKTSQRAEPTRKSVARPVFRGNGFDGSDMNGDLEDEADALAKRMAEAAAQTLVVLDDSVSDIDLHGEQKPAEEELGESFQDMDLPGNTASTAPENAVDADMEDSEGAAAMIESSFVDTSDDRKENANSKILSGMYESIGKPIPEELREKKVEEPQVDEKTLEDRAMQSYFAKLGMVAPTPAAEVSEAAETAAETAETVAEASANVAETVAETVDNAAETAAETVAAAVEAAAEEKPQEEKKPYDPVTKTGYHEETYANGEHYTGDFVNGKRHGVGRMEYQNGDVYEGGYNMGKRHGQGIMTYAAGSRYEGNWENSIKSGQGRFVQANGEVYEGNFEGGTFEGHGSYQFSNGNTYIGNWKGGKRDGTGVLIYANGAKEAQVWEGGKKVFAEIVDDPFTVEAEAAEAAETAENAAETAQTAENVAEEAVQTAENAVETAQAAEFAAGEVAQTAESVVEEAAQAAENAAEEAAQTVENAVETAVQAAENTVAEAAEAVEAAGNEASEAVQAAENAVESAPVIAAPVKETKSINYKSGNRYEGEVDDKNLPHGNGVFTYTNGSSYEGEFEHGVRCGYGVFRWSTGDSYEGGWKDDKRHGEGVMKYANGRVRKGRFENNEYVGI